MSYELVIKPQAEEDAGEAALWYNEQRENLGIEFLEELGEALSRIKINPFLFQTKYRNVHVAFCRRFPFGVYFIVERNQVFIIAILHTSRNPMIWKRRASR